MHVARVRSVHGGRAYVSVLLRQSYREGQRVRHRTLASLTALPHAGRNRTRLRHPIATRSSASLLAFPVNCPYTSH